MTEPPSDRRPESEIWFDRAVEVMPGGVNSPVRAFKSVGGTPAFAASASGPQLTTVDGDVLVDFIASWGALILGHAEPAIVAAVEEAARKGTSFGLPTSQEVELAELVTKMIPSIEILRMVNSGTEATASAIRVARAATGRPGIVKFEGCYHGHADPFLVKAGSGAATLGVPDSPGVPASTVADTYLARFNDLDSVERALAGGSAAAVIVEPVAGNMGVVPPVPGFLQDLRDLCDLHGALLIFDEVMTGFRVARGGAQERYGVTPDLTCLGKVVAGGTPAAVYGGRADLMRRVGSGRSGLSGGDSGRQSARGGRRPGHAALHRGESGSLREARSDGSQSGGSTRRGYDGKRSPRLCAAGWCDAHCLFRSGGGPLMG